MKRRLLFAATLILPSLLGWVALGPQTAVASASASFYASPSSGSYNVGDAIHVSILINSGGQAINAGEATITWSSGLQYSFVSTAGSIFTTWASGGGAGPVGSASSVYFSGGLSNPGYNGSGGRVATITFNAVTAGTFTVNVAGSQILANDGLGTNVYCCSNGATFTVAAAKPPVPLLTINSKTHPNQNQWYTAHDVLLNWFATTAVGNYSFSVDHNAGTIPTAPNNATINTNYTLDDGLWYFHLKGSNQTGGSTVNFVIRIDSKPPDNFQVTMDNGGNASNPTPKANFNATDATSGVDHYTANIDGTGDFAISSGTPIPKQHPGDHTIVVTAVDGAGNSTQSSTKFHVEGIGAPKILTFPTSLVILKPMDYIGQSSADDTIFVYLDDKLIEQFVAKDKQVSKAKDKGTGGFTNGITWEYVYKPQLFPGSYKIHFSRTNNVGAESTPTKDYVLKITATAGVKPKPIPWYLRDLVNLLILALALQFALEIFFYAEWRYDARLLRKVSNKVAIPQPTQQAMRKVAKWQPFGWLVKGTLKAQRGFLRITPLGRRRAREDTKPNETQKELDKSE